MTDSGPRSASHPPSEEERDRGIASALVEDLLYQGFQAQSLVDGVVGLVREGEFPTAYSDFSVDPRTGVVARAMRVARDGTGDICSPGPASPAPCFAFGATPLEFLRHAAGKGTSSASARTGGHSWTDLRRGLVAEAGPMGTMTQVVSGAALAFKQRSQDRVALVFERASAAETGAWHEGMNLAAAQRAPMIVVLVAGTAEEESGGLRIARGYGVPFERLSGTYPEILARTRMARSLAASGGGPTLMELPPLDPAASSSTHASFAAWAVASNRIEQEGVERIERTARMGVENALARLRNEPGPDPHAALTPVRTDALPIPPWTRQDPAKPDNRTPLEGAGDLRVR